jgi:hypothetical protein
MIQGFGRLVNSRRCPPHPSSGAHCHRSPSRPARYVELCHRMLPTGCRLGRRGIAWLSRQWLSQQLPRVGPGVGVYETIAHRAIGEMVSPTLYLYRTANKLIEQTPNEADESPYRCCRLKESPVLTGTCHLRSRQEDYRVSPLSLDRRPCQSESRRQQSHEPQDYTLSRQAWSHLATIPCLANPHKLPHQTDYT